MELSAANANPQSNRYVNVVPFDYNRVVLSDGPSDYINASLMASKEGAVPSWSYIATQGPLPHAVAQFWQMVLEQRSAVIVMLTKTHDRHVEKCAQYFPLHLEEEVDYGSAKRVISVRVSGMRHLDEDICLRELTITDSLTDVQHQVCHYHYHRCHLSSCLPSLLRVMHMWATCSCQLQGSMNPGLGLTKQDLMGQGWLDIVACMTVVLDILTKQDLLD